MFTEIVGKNTIDKNVKLLNYVISKWSISYETVHVYVLPI